MAKPPEHHRERWTPEQVKELKQLANENTPTRVLGLKLGRTPEAVQAKAASEHISLNPPNQRPYNRRKKR
jgi:hypothetical protein